jgi:hypothetical protein
MEACSGVLLFVPNASETQQKVQNKTQGNVVGHVCCVNLACSGFQASF